jgi:hypothetical protein
MPIDLCVNCSDQGCQFYREPIRLLFANPGGTDDGRAGWPEDGTELYLACPACRRVSVHCQADLRDFPEEDGETDETHQLWIRVAMLCGAEGCNTPAEFHVLMNQGTNNHLAFELHGKLDMMHWTGMLPCGHDIAPVPPGLWYFDRPQLGRLWGYNSVDPRWATLWLQERK